MPTDTTDTNGLVPVVDLDAPDAARGIDAASRDVGSFSVRGHGVAASTITQMLDATAALLALPLEAKFRCRSPSADVNRGYAAKCTESLVYSLGQTEAPPDLFEAFNIGPDDYSQDDPAYRAERGRLFAPNIRPDHPSVGELRPV